jgi:hypothetical protein
LFQHLSLLKLKKNPNPKPINFGIFQKELNLKQDHGLLEAPLTEVENMYILRNL